MELNRDERTNGGDRYSLRFNRPTFLSLLSLPNIFFTYLNCDRASILAYICVYVCVHVRALIHTYIYTYIYTYTYIYEYSKMKRN